MIVAKPDQITNITCLFTLAENKFVMHTLAEGTQVSLRSCRRNCSQTIVLPEEFLPCLVVLFGLWEGSYSKL